MTFGKVCHMTYSRVSHLSFGQTYTKSSLFIMLSAIDLFELFDFANTLCSHFQKYRPKKSTNGRILIYKVSVL